MGIGEPFLVFGVFVVRTVSEDALVQNAVSKLDGPPVVSNQIRLHPAGEAIGVAQHGGQADQSGGGLHNTREQNLNRAAAFDIGQQLQFIRDDKFDFFETFGPPHQNLREFFIDDDGDGEVALFKIAVVIAVIARGDQHMDAIGLVFVLEVSKLLFRQGFQRNEIHDLLAPEGGLHRCHLADEGLAGAGGGLNEKIAVTEQAVFLHGQLLQRQQAGALARLPKLDDVRRHVVTHQVVHEHLPTLPYLPSPRKVS